MHKLGKKEYLMMIADALVSEYGSTLIEEGTDIKMAKATLRKLKPFLFFHPSDVSDKDYNKWLTERNVEVGIWEWVENNDGPAPTKLTNGIKTWKKKY